VPALPENTKTLNIFRRQDRFILLLKAKILRFSAKPDESGCLRKAILQRNAITT
jgi:hypothetical protein